ncbi:MAG: hypothetical protein EZS28_030919 [Streblomastix strix]|uniref:Coenzyme PQQ synthesis protein F-like C-terminal lobe domain-containing protein n=1 Tax=Streblomastix strix TaxID=222440 RepID=A0A5J4UT51_9EUKA|nr:MAG: hypothetical protein EZS28_030919 [Streblomastix strix]
MKNIWKQFRIECFVLGNCTAEDAVHLGKRMWPLYQQDQQSSSSLSSSSSTALPFKPMPLLLNELKVRNTIQLPPNLSVVLDYVYDSKAEQNSVILLRIASSAQNDYRQHAAIMILSLILEKQLFERLRTQEQLGYKVQSYFGISVGCPCFNVSIQSGTYDPLHLHSRIDSHLEDLIMNELPNMSLKDFFIQKQGSIRLYRDAPTDINFEFNNYSPQIQSHRYSFIEVEAITCAIETLTFPEFLMRAQSFWRGKIYLGQIIIPQYLEKECKNKLQDVSCLENKQKTEINDGTSSVKKQNSFSIIEEVSYNVDDPRTFPFGSRAYFRVFAPRWKTLKNKPPQEMNIQKDISIDNVKDKSAENKNEVNIVKLMEQLLKGKVQELNETQNNNKSIKRPNCPPSPVPYFFVKDVHSFRASCNKWGNNSLW